MKVLYIDPQSGFNLAQYDYNLLGSINADIIYCCSIIYDAPILKGVEYKPVFRYNTKKNSILKAISYIISLIKILIIAKRIKPSVIHIQWWRLWLVDYWMLSLFKHYCESVVFTAHNILPHDSADSYRTQVAKYYKRVNKIIVHVECSKKVLVASFGIAPNKIYVIPHGLLKMSYNQKIVSMETQRLRSEWKTQDKIVFSLIGYQSQYKGTDVFLSAYENNPVLHSNEKVLFIVAGKGNIITKTLMEKYQNLLVFDDFISSELLEAVMNVTDVQILPYRQISQSGVLLTAIEKGIPYIATNVGGLSEPISIAPIGWLLKSSSADEIASFIGNLFNCPEEISEKKADAESWEKIRSYYDWKSIGVKTMKCYMD